MTTEGMISMAVIMGLVWGGFGMCLALLVRRDRREARGETKGER